MSIELLLLMIFFGTLGFVQLLHWVIRSATRNDVRQPGTPRTQLEERWEHRRPLR